MQFSGNFMLHTIHLYNRPKLLQEIIGDLPVVSNTLLLTNCEANTAKYPDHSFDLWTE